MKRDLIKAFDHDQIPVAAARLWDAEPQSLHWLANNRSFIYKFSTRGGVARVLRMTHESRRQSHHIAAELDFVTYLSVHGLEVVRPIPSRHDQWIEILQTPLGRFTLSCFMYAEGASRSAPWRADREAYQQEFGKLGRWMGRMHRLSKTYQPTGPRRFRWDEEPLASDQRLARYLVEPAIRAEHRLLLDWLSQQYEAPDRFGLVHADLSVDNIVVEANSLQLFDFDNCCYHWYLYDIAGALMSIANVSKADRRRLLDTLLEGYAAEEPPPPYWLEDINMFWRWRTLSRYVDQMRRQEMALIPPWQQNRRQIEPFPIARQPPWFQNHLTVIQQQMFGRFEW